MLSSSPLSPLARYAGGCELDDMADVEKGANGRGRQLLLGWRQAGDGLRRVLLVGMMRYGDKSLLAMERDVNRRGSN